MRSADDERDDYARLNELIDTAVNDFDRRRREARNARQRALADQWLVQNVRQAVLEAYRLGRTRKPIDGP